MESALPEVRRRRVAQDMDWTPEIASALCRPDRSSAGVPATFPSPCHRQSPSPIGLHEIVDALRRALFPGFLDPEGANDEDLVCETTGALDFVATHLAVQIDRGFALSRTPNPAAADSLVRTFIEQLPSIQALLASDVEAAYDGDPAATSREETIVSYPGILAVLHYRLAHELARLGIPIVPRMMTELAHSQTGIDIHPRAEIGERFFIDHGTGVVIGETAVVGRNVRMYQGVTLGALSFPADERGFPVKGIPRHPIVEDDVILYAGATILGRVTIGRGSIIGGGVWLTRSVPPGSVLTTSRAEEATQRDVPTRR
ncbi:MAG: serine acetyltransferase [Candidatus Bipolaricaulota bacterium]